MWALIARGTRESAAWRTHSTLGLGPWLLFRLLRTNTQLTRKRAIEDPLLQGASLFPMPPDPGSCFSFRHLVVPRFPFPFHYHPDMEITWVVRGRGRRVTGETVREFKPGGLAVMGPMLPHFWLSEPGSEETEVYVLRFDRAMLETRFGGLPECAQLLKFLSRSDFGLETTSPVAIDPGFGEIKTARPGAARLIAFLSLLAALANRRDWNPICSEVQSAVVRGSSEQRIGFAVRYLMEHAEEEITQETVARRVGLSPAAFSRLFRKVSGETFQKTRLALRIEHACRLLSGSQMPIVEICHACGFQNLSNFNRQFLTAKGRTPTSYRRTTQGRDLAGG